MYNETRGLVKITVKCKTMGKYRNSKLFPNERQEKTFLYPHVCLSCRKSFKKSHSEQPRLCPDCQQPLILLSRNFSAPKTNDEKQWKKVAFLIEQGFLFQHVYQNEWGGQYAAYPKTLAEASEFVVKYKKWAIQNDT